MRIILTGTPGTGKTAIAAVLARRLGYPLVSLTSFVRYRKLANRQGEVDLRQLRKALLPLIRKNKNLVIEGHLACEITLPADFVIVARCNPRILRRRLKKRKYPEKKQEANVLAELLDYATQKSGQHYRVSLLEIETGNLSISHCSQKILQAIKLKKKKLDRVDYSNLLRKELGLE